MKTISQQYGLKSLKKPKKVIKSDYRHSSSR